MCPRKPVPSAGKLSPAGLRTALLAALDRLEYHGTDDLQTRNDRVEGKGTDDESNQRLERMHAYGWREHDHKNYSLHSTEKYVSLRGITRLDCQKLRFRSRGA